MAIYLTVFGSIAMFVLFEKPRICCLDSGYWLFAPYIKKRNFWITVLAAVIIILASIRWEIGTDWNAFLSDFEYMQKASSLGEVNSGTYGISYGKGYVLLTYFFAKFVGNYSVYLGFQAFLIVVCVYPVIYKYSRFPGIAFLGLFAFSFGYMTAVPRSGFAIAFCFRAFDLLIENKKLRSCIFILLASLFHNTALVFLFVFLLDKIHLKIRKYVLILSIAIGFSLLAKPVLLWITSLPFIPFSISARINVYLSEVDYGGVSGLIRFLTRGFVVVLIFVYLWKKRGKREINLLVNIYLLSIVIYIAVANISEVYMRLAYYYEDVSQFIIFSECVASEKNKKDRFILRVIMISFFTVKLLSRLIGNDFMVPFRTIFF